MSPPDSGGLKWILVDSPRLMSSGDSVRLCRTCPVEKYDRIPWTPPDKKCQFGPCHTKKVRVTSPPESGGIRRSPVGHVGQCTVLHSFLPFCSTHRLSPEIYRLL